MALQRALRQNDLRPEERAAELEQLIGEAVNLDQRLLLSMDPTSIVSMLKLGDFDEHLGEYVVRSMYLEANLLDEAGQSDTASLRRMQAAAIAKEYNIDVNAEDVSPQALEEFFDEQEKASQPLSS